MKSTFFAFLMFFGLSVFAQPIINKQLLTSEYLKQYAIDFKLDDKSSEGYKLMESLVAEHDYLVLGEFHFSENIQLLCKEFLQLGTQYGYTDFIQENGRYTSQFMNEMMVNSSNIEETIGTYIRKNRNTVSYGDGKSEQFYPIPFFNSKQEMWVLEELKKNYRNIGLDQEFCFSTRMFVERLSKIKKTPQKLLDSIYARIESYERKSCLSDFNMYKALYEDTLINNYFANAKIQGWDKIYATWKESMGIYFGRSRHWRRVNLIRRNFIEQMQERVDTIPDLKFIVKFGAVHTPKGLTNFGCYDIGDLVCETAKQKNKKSIHITCARRYCIEDGKCVDELKGQENNPEFVFDRLGQKDNWVILDLRKVREDYENNKFVLPEGFDYHNLKLMMEQQDILILLPMDRELVDF